MSPGLVTLLGFAAVGGLITWGVLAALLKTPWALRIAADIPNQRSLHVGAVPRIGGLVAVGSALAIGAVAAPSQAALLIIAAALLSISALDDRYGLPVLTRLLGHLVAAMLLVLLSGANLPWWMALVLIVAVAWFINAYNFMDGADGLAGGMAIFGFMTLSLVAASGGHYSHAVLAAAIAGSAGGFLIHNLPPARVFLGDAGSVPLGFLAAALGLTGWSAGLWPAWFPILVFSPFLFDATFTLASRLIKGARPWKAHREHLYQHLALGRLGRRGTALLWYCLMAASATTASAALSWPFQWQIGLLVAWATFYASLFGVLSRRTAAST
jgi:UDP-N-acetylmuramyl pentapeptide phosphotransferase/UDP-N-acetylglucosamine-1-phosphate transferase